MNMLKKIAKAALAAGVGLIGTVNAATVAVNADISTSVTWTAGNTYQLKKQIYVLPGATLTIEAGTLVRSLVADQGSLAVCRGAQIFAQGTEDAPIIMTSSNDTLTAWHEGCNEWGNLTLMGDALVSASHYGGSPVVTLGRTNTKMPDGLNQKQMEGLVADPCNPSYVVYGGDNDDDDSGVISYVSLRYGGKVVGLANELNGLSLGGIGRNTDIHHIDIMNNVDDGIEIWGGTVNLKYVNIWNIGDDSFDVDEGWRGKVQFGLIVQGFSTNASQGSGVGDNCFETDGAEDSDAQPVTSSVIYNFTVIGQPVAGDHGTAWRDNARIQYRNCIFMQLGEVLVKNDNSDGDGGNGYGYNGTLSFNNTWTTAYSVDSTVNAMSPAPAAGDFNHPLMLYRAQTSGNLAEISDSLFYDNDFSTAYSTYDTIVALTGDNCVNNVKNTTDSYPTNKPIVSLTRGAAVTKGGLTMLPVTSIDPRATGVNTTSVATAPNDGFFTPVNYRGGFSPDNNWLQGWTSVYAYGMTPASSQPDERADVNGDGVVNLADFAILSGSWTESM